MFSTGSIVVLSFGVFFASFVAEFHASRSAISFAFTLHNVCAALAIPLLGGLIDRVGPRRVILVGTTLFGLLLLSSKLLDARIEIAYLFFATLGLVGGTTSPVPYGVAVARWFDQHRGLALGLMAVGLGIGGVLMPLAAQRLIATVGWRNAYATLGCIVVVISLPVVALWLRDDPQQMGLQPDGAMNNTLQAVEIPTEGLSWYVTWHRPSFWLLVLVFFLAGIGLYGCMAHLPALLADRGLSARSGAAASAIVGLALLVGRFGAGYLLDRMFAPRLAMIVFGLAAVGIALLWSGGAAGVALLAAFLIGMGMGAEVDIIVYSLSRYFGVRALGTAFGVGFASYVLAGALGVWLMGAGFDLAQSYSLPLAVSFVSMVAAVALLSRLGPYVYAPRDLRTQTNKRSEQLPQ